MRRYHEKDHPRFFVVHPCFFPFLAGCSNNDSDPVPSIVGSWVISDSSGDCDYDSDFDINANGTFSIEESEDCPGTLDDYAWGGIGEWDIENGILVVYFTSTDPVNPDIDLGEDILLYYFIGSNGKLSITGELDMFQREGSGSGIVGSWKSKDGEEELAYDEFCVYLDIYSNNTYDYESTCDEESNSGTYSTSGDVLTIDGEDQLYFKVFGNYMAITEPQEMYTRQ